MEDRRSIEEAGNSNFNPCLSSVQIKGAMRLIERKKWGYGAFKRNILHRKVLLGETLSSLFIFPVKTILGFYVVQKDGVF